MRVRTLFLAGAAIVAGSLPASAQDALTLQLKWVTQGQFAGYYVAADQGFYEEAGLDVTINPGGPDIAPTQVIAGDGADVIVEWMPAALAARERGLPLVNIAQPFARSGMQLTCRNETGITSPEDFAGKTLGVWFSGNEYPFLSWMSKLGLATEGGGEKSVSVIRQGFNVDPLIQKQADCISTMNYNEYWQVIDAGIPESELTVFAYSDQGVATLEDGLWTTDEKLAEDGMTDKLARFVKASMRGWAWARENPEEAAQIVLDNDMTGAQTEEHQVRMVGEIVKLLSEDPNGALDAAAAEQTVDVLMSEGSDPVITARPEGAWTADVTDAAAALQ